jgi:hypothetical protein
MAAWEAKQEDTAVGYEMEGYDLAAGEQLGRQEATRGKAAATGASPDKLLQMDIDILNTKLRTARAHHDISEQMKLETEYAELLKQHGETAAGVAEAKLGMMRTMADQGLISEDAYRNQERQMALMYQNMARSAGVGTAEYYQYMQKALEALAGDTQDKWDRIVGKIIGAPSSMLQSVSDAGIIGRFGDAVIGPGMGGDIRADIVGQRHSSMDIRIRWDDINAIDGKVQGAVQAGMNGFARDFKMALAG